MSDVLLPGITATRVATPRLTQNVLHPEGVDPAAPGCYERELMVSRTLELISAGIGA